MKDFLVSPGTDNQPGASVELGTGTGSGEGQLPGHSGLGAGCPHPSRHRWLQEASILGLQPQHKSKQA